MLSTILIQFCIISSINQSPFLKVECSSAWSVPENGKTKQHNDIEDPNYVDFKEFMRLATQPHNGITNPLYKIAIAKQMAYNERERQKNLVSNIVPSPIIADDSSSIPFEDIGRPQQPQGPFEDEEGVTYIHAHVLDRQSNDIRSSDDEIYLLEDKDYPKSIYENYNGIGQVAGITALPNNDVAIFHRADREWARDTFDSNFMVRDGIGAQDNLIKNNTIFILDGNNGSAIMSFGSNLFYMPHGIASDGLGNLWVTDVARHQVMRLPTAGLMRQTDSVVSADSDMDSNEIDHEDYQVHGSMKMIMKKNIKAEKIPTTTPPVQLWPDIIIGEAFVPGTDSSHFCQPSEVVVSSDGRMVYVADGYCNKRVSVFTGAGKFLTYIGGNLEMDVVHSLALSEEQNLLHVADREKRRIFSFKAGLGNESDSIGQLMNIVDYPIGRVFALTTIGPDHLLVSSNGDRSNRFDIAVLNPFKQEIKPIWTSSDLVVPHALTHTKDNYYAYAADLSKDSHKKVFKFDVIQRTS